MKRIIITALILSAIVVCQAQNDIPKTVRELGKWEKAMKVKADEGDVDACRQLGLSNYQKYAYYGLRAMELYQQQGTGEAYYHLAELNPDNVELRDSLLRLSSQMGYAKADEQIQVLRASVRESETTEPTSEETSDPQATSVSVSAQPQNVASVNPLDITHDSAENTQQAKETPSSASSPRVTPNVQTPQSSYQFSAAKTVTPTKKSTSATKKCSSCKGSGKTSCHWCNGKGSVAKDGNDRMVINCYCCSGYGKETCFQCNGKGTTR